jgi:surface protein
MFRSSSLNRDLSSWDVSSVRNMGGMSRQATAFNGDFLYTSRVTTMKAMFNGASAFNGDVSLWDVSNFTDMEMCTIGRFICFEYEYVLL